MFDNEVQFTKKDMDKYLGELAKAYKRLGGRNTPVEIVLVGGAAVIENYGFRNMTTDIDAILPAVSIMKEAIRQVADTFHLPRGWMNADCMRTASYSPKLLVRSKPYRTFNQVLQVRYISGEYLIAMKLKSGREYKTDLSDIVGVLAAHEKQGNPISFESISEAVSDLYGSMDQISERSLAFLRSVMEHGEFEKMHTAIRESEKNSRQILVDFEQAYPGELTAERVSSVIDAGTKNRADKASVRATLARLKQEQQEENHIDRSPDRGEER